MHHNICAVTSLARAENKMCAHFDDYGVKYLYSMHGRYYALIVGHLSL